MPLDAFVVNPHAGPLFLNINRRLNYRKHHFVKAALKLISRGAHHRPARGITLLGVSWDEQLSPRVLAT
jgi:hypothetical protein